MPKKGLEDFVGVDCYYVAYAFANVFAQPCVKKARDRKSSFFAEMLIGQNTFSKITFKNRF